MKILIADDEPLARMRIRSLIKEIGGLEVLDIEAANGREVIEFSKTCAPDLVLLDIGMPGINGMEAARQLADLPTPPIIIFITAYDEYALEAFNRQAIDYLLKPVSKERLQQALQRAALLYRIPHSNKPNTEQIQEVGARTHISVVVHGETRLIPVDKIYYFRADHKYITLRWSGGEALMDESLKGLEPEFAGQFIRVHRNAMVALVQISGIKKNLEGQYFLTFKDIPDVLEISRRHLQPLKQTIRDMWGKRSKDFKGLDDD
jgi:two-component system, LytTR family, response regulator AlgR